LQDTATARINTAIQNRRLIFFRFVNLFFIGIGFKVIS